MTQEICQAVDYADNWIYYVDELGTSIYKVRFDGSEKQKLTDCNSNHITFFKVINNWVYYMNWGADGGLFKIKTDGSCNEKISDRIPRHNCAGLWDNWVLTIGMDTFFTMIRLSDTHETDELIDEILAEVIANGDITKIE